MIGANPEAIDKAEDRNLFKKSMERIGLSVPASRVVKTVAEALQTAAEIGLPVILRPSFTLGGTGGGVAYNVEELMDLAKGALDVSPIHEVLIEQSVLGWKEFELEVMRDLKDNVVIICSIENFDPMGVHTGDSITVAPVQTLTDREYQTMRDASVAIIREIGVETGGSNIQFAIHPGDGRMMVIEMNPRVSRSSALASKATGFPIAKIAARLAAGYTLDEIRNDITLKTPACFEPTIDYCVVKVPRFTFEKFPQTQAVLTTSMRSVGEAMAIGRTFKEALQKALRSLEIGAHGLDDLPKMPEPEELRRLLATPGPQRVFHIKQAIKAGFSLDGIHQLTMIDPWFLDNILQIVEFEEGLKGRHAAAGGGAAGLRARPSSRPSRWASATCNWPASSRPTNGPCAIAARPSASAPSTSPWTRAPPSSRPLPRTTTPPMNKKKNNLRQTARGLRTRRAVGAETHRASEGARRLAGAGPHPRLRVAVHPVDRAAGPRVRRVQRDRRPRPLGPGTGGPPAGGHYPLGRTGQRHHRRQPHV